LGLSGIRILLWGFLAGLLAAGQTSLWSFLLLLIETICACSIGSINWSVTFNSSSLSLLLLLEFVSTSNNFFQLSWAFNELFDKLS